LRGVFAQFLVIPPHGFCKSGRHWIAINRSQRILRFAAREFFGYPVPHFDERLHDL